VTLAGKPYTGYPQFSSPNALAEALKAAGVDVLVNANNHAADRGKSGIIKPYKRSTPLQYHTPEHFRMRPSVTPPTRSFW